MQHIQAGVNAEESRGSNEGWKDVQKMEMESSEFLCSAGMYVWFEDGSSDRTTIMHATSMQK